MDEIVERIENKFINIYKKFDILDKKLNNFLSKISKRTKNVSPLKKVDGC